jgi:hypothetical protein
MASEALGFHFGVPTATGRVYFNARVVMGIDSSIRHTAAHNRSARDVLPKTHTAMGDLA